MLIKFSAGVGNRVGAGATRDSQEVNPVCRIVAAAKIEAAKHACSETYRVVSRPAGKVHGGPDDPAGRQCHRDIGVGSTGDGVEIFQVIDQVEHHGATRGSDVDRSRGRAFRVEVDRGRERGIDDEGSGVEEDDRIALAGRTGYRIDPVSGIYGIGAGPEVDLVATGPRRYRRSAARCMDRQIVREESGIQVFEAVQAGA